MAKIYADKGYEPKKLRDLHFDMLIAHPHALTAPS